jgi:hypothetical protein
MVFISLCYLMAIIIYLFYPVSSFVSIAYESRRAFANELIPAEIGWKDSRGNGLALRAATKVGVLFERDMAYGEVFHSF